MLGLKSGTGAAFEFCPAKLSTPKSGGGAFSNSSGVFRLRLNMLEKDEKTDVRFDGCGC